MAIDPDTLKQAPPLSEQGRSGFFNRPQKTLKKNSGPDQAGVVSAGQAGVSEVNSGKDGDILRKLGF